MLDAPRTPALDALVRQAQRDCGVAGSGVAGSGVAGSGVAGSGVAGSGVSGTVGAPAAMGPAAMAALLEKLVAAPQLWSPSVRHEPTSRWYGSLFRDDVVDLWLLTWQQDNSTDLHDHGGSSGAFRVVSGALSEFRPALDHDGDVVLRRTVRRPGATVSFGPRLVHDIHHVDAAPAVSLHVYSPPLTAMTYYDLAGRGLSARHTEPVDVREAGKGIPERAVTVEA